MCLYWLLVCITFLSQTNAESVEENDSFSLSVLVVGLLASVVIISGALLLCAGDSKDTKVEHNDKENEKLNHNGREFANQRNRQAFQEIEFSHTKQDKNRIQQIKTSINTENDRKVVTNVQKDVDFHNDNNVLLNNERSMDNVSRESSEIKRMPNNDINVGPSRRYDNQQADQPIERSSTHELSDYDLHDNRPLSYDMVNEQEVRDNRQNFGSRNNRQSREDTRTTDDIGYHSDFSKSIKPDTESSQLSTFRTSQPHSNARSITNYDLDDDVIETYNDDGESIDWN